MRCMTEYYGTLPTRSRDWPLMAVVRDFSLDLHSSLMPSFLLVPKGIHCRQGNTCLWKQTNQKVKSKEWISVSRSWVYWPATFIIQSFFGLQTQKCKRTFNKSLSLSITNQPTNQPTNQSSSSVDNHYKKCNMFLTWTLTFPQSPYQRRSLRAQTSPSLSQSL